MLCLYYHLWQTGCMSASCQAAYSSPVAFCLLSAAEEFLFTGFHVLESCSCRRSCCLFLNPGWLQAWGAWEPAALKNLGLLCHVQLASQPAMALGQGNIIKLALCEWGLLANPSHLPLSREKQPMGSPWPPLGYTKTPSFSLSHGRDVESGYLSSA